jgi:hypothetical protein
VLAGPGADCADDARKFMRLSEVLHLHIDDIGPSHATVLNGKGGKSRCVPLTAEVRADLVKRAGTRNGFIFADPTTGNVPTQEATSVAYGRLAKKLGLKGVSHHVLRHTGASAMVAAGVSLRAVQEIGGWTSLRMLERCADPTQEEMQRAVRVLADSTAGTNAGTAANRALKGDEPESRQRVVGLEDWHGVPTGFRGRLHREILRDCRLIARSHLSHNRSSACYAAPAPRPAEPPRQPAGPRPVGNGSKRCGNAFRARAHHAGYRPVAVHRTAGVFSWIYRLTSPALAGWRTRAAQGARLFSCQSARPKFLGTSG